MGIDLNKMRAKHAALTNRGGDSSDIFGSLKMGHKLFVSSAPTGEIPSRSAISIMD